MNQVRKQKERTRRIRADLKRKHREERNRDREDKRKAGQSERLFDTSVSQGV
jgi:hypothetical protein